MEEITATVENTAKTTEEASQVARRNAEIIDTIDGIAVTAMKDQTMLLSGEVARFQVPEVD